LHTVYTYLAGLKSGREGQGWKGREKTKGGEVVRDAWAPPRMTISDPQKYTSLFRTLMEPRYELRQTYDR